MPCFALAETGARPFTLLLPDHYCGPALPSARGPPAPPSGSRMPLGPPRSAAAPKFGHLIIKCIKGVELKVRDAIPDDYDPSTEGGIKCAQRKSNHNLSECAWKISSCERFVADHEAYTSFGSRCFLRYLRLAFELGTFTPGKDKKNTILYIYEYL